MHFTMQRDRTIASKHGHSIDFKKGVPTHVPPIPALYDEVQAAGAVPLESIPEPDAPVSREPGDPIERKALVMEAFAELALENDPKKFTAGGAPHVTHIKDLLGFSLEARERDTLWQEYLLGNLNATTRKD